MLDADEQPFDVYRVVQFFKCNEHISNDDIKHTIIQQLVKALDKISNFADEPQYALLGLVQYCLLAPTYLQVPYRDDQQLNEQNKMLKIQCYQQQRWNKLMEMIEKEQNKHNERELRRNHNTSSAPTQTGRPKQQQIPESKENDNTRTFINDTPTNRFVEPFDLTAIAKNVQNMKYYDADTEDTIKCRLRRCVKKANEG